MASRRDLHDEPLRAGVVGVGHFGRLITATLSSATGVRICALCDVSEDRRCTVAAEFGVADAYADYREMLRTQALDAVFIATPEGTHVEPTLCALAAGAHVFVEKPLALSLSDARPVVAAARASDRQLMVGHILRFDPRLVDLKRRLDAGELGRVVSLYARRSLTRRALTVPQTGHPWLTLGIHDIDAALWLLEDRPTAIYAVGRSIWGGPAGDAHWAIMQMNQGSVIVLETTACVPEMVGDDLEAHTRLVGTLATATIDGAGVGYSIEGAGSRSTPPVIYGLELPDRRICGALAAEIEYFLGCIATGRAIQFGTLDQACMAMAVAEAIIRAESAGREIRVEWHGEEPWYRET